MKKILITLGVLFITGICAYAEDNEAFDCPDLTMKNFWQQNGKYQEKVISVGTKIFNANKLDKRIVLRVNKDTKLVNAYADPFDKTVNIYKGILPYLDNDDELAYVIGHETAHCLDFYDGGIFKVVTIQFNKKAYEYKADLVGVDLMTKAGYNPIAAITAQNKVLTEQIWANLFFTSHPKGSNRQLAIYEYIYRKYPWALNTEMVHNVNYENFVYSQQKEINEFIQEDKEREKRRGENL